MALRIVSQEFGVASGHVIIAGDKQSEPISHEAVEMALKAAGAAGLRTPGRAKLPRPYPVDAAGQTSDDLYFGRNGAKVAEYRARHEINGAL